MGEAPPFFARTFYDWYFRAGRVPAVGGQKKESSACVCLNGVLGVLGGGVVVVVVLHDAMHIACWPWLVVSNPGAVAVVVPLPVICAECGDRQLLRRL